MHLNLREIEAAMLRFYGGIHYRHSVETGLNQGKKGAGNILRKFGLNEKRNKYRCSQYKKEAIVNQFQDSFFHAQQFIIMLGNFL